MLNNGLFLSILLYKMPSCCSGLKLLGNGCSRLGLKLNELCHWFWWVWRLLCLVLELVTVGQCGTFSPPSLSGLSDCYHWSNRLLSSFAKVADVRVIRTQQGRSSLWLPAESAKSFSNMLLMHKHSWGRSPSVAVKVFSLGRWLEEHEEWSYLKISVSLIRSLNSSLPTIFSNLHYKGICIIIQKQNMKEFKLKCIKPLGENGL